jgi:hypothetical protein
VAIPVPKGVELEAERIITYVKDMYFESLPAEKRNPESFETSIIPKTLSDLRFFFCGCQDIVGHIVPRTFDAGFQISGITRYPNLQAPKENPYPDILPEHLVDVDLNQASANSDVIIVTQPVFEVAVTLQQMLSIPNFFDGKGIIFLAKDGHDIMWKAITSILEEHHIIHLIVTVPSEGYIPWIQDVYSNGKCFVSGHSDFFVQIMNYLMKCVVAMDQLTYLGSGKLVFNTFY